MSQWTHIRGGMQLESSPYEQKKFTLEEPDKSKDEDAWYKWRIAWGKSFYLPYPEEQFKLSMPGLGWYCGKKKKDGTREEGRTLEFRAYLYSLPRAKKYLDEAFKLLPQGECGFRYSIKQDVYDGHSSCSGFMTPCLNKYYKDALTRMYHNEDSFYNYTADDLFKWFHVDKECSVESITGMVIGIRDDIRYCSGEEMMKGLEEFFKYLAEHDITVEDGYLEWEDEYEPDVRYAWRNSRLSFGIEHQFLVLDKKTNKILKSKTYVHKRDENGKLDWKAYDNHEFDIIEEEFPDAIDQKLEEDDMASWKTNKKESE